MEVQQPPQGTENRQGTSSYHDPSYAASLSALQIRLDTKPILDDFENFLKGSRIIVVEEKGEIKTKTIETGEAKANPLGIQSIMQELSMIINSQTVQGNITKEAFDCFIKEVHIDFTTNLVNNCYNWEIEDDDLDLIIDCFIHHVQLFVSRTVDNQERVSYGQTMKVIESNTTQHSKAGLNLFGGRGQ